MWARTLARIEAPSRVSAATLDRAPRGAQRPRVSRPSTSPQKAARAVPVAAAGLPGVRRRRCRRPTAPLPPPVAAPPAHMEPPRRVAGGAVAAASAEIPKWVAPTPARPEAPPSSASRRMTPVWRCRRRRHPRSRRRRRPLRRCRLLPMALPAAAAASRATAAAAAAAASCLARAPNRLSRAACRRCAVLDGVLLCSERRRRGGGGAKAPRGEPEILPLLELPEPSPTIPHTYVPAPASMVVAVPLASESTVARQASVAKLAMGRRARRGRRPCPSDRTARWSLHAHLQQRGSFRPRMRSVLRLAEHRGAELARASAEHDAAPAATRRRVAWCARRHRCGRSGWTRWSVRRPSGASASHASAARTCALLPQQLRPRTVRERGLGYVEQGASPQVRDARAWLQRQMEIIDGPVGEAMGGGGGGGSGPLGSPAGSSASTGTWRSPVAAYGPRRPPTVTRGYCEPSKLRVARRLGGGRPCSSHPGAQAGSVRRLHGEEPGLASSPAAQAALSG